MKIFSKVLAMMLALVTVLALIPLNAIADTWLDVDAVTDGEGSKVTVTLDAAHLAELLQNEGVSPDLLKTLLADASVDREALKKVFSTKEFFEIIPKDKLLEAIDFEKLVDEIGFEKLNEYVDIATLVQNVSKEELAALLADVPGLHNYVDVMFLINEGYIPAGIITAHLYEEELKVAVGTVDPNEIVPDILALNFAQIEQLIRIYELIDDTDGEPVINPVDVLNMTVAQQKAEELFKKPGFQVSNYLSYVNEAGTVAYFKNKYAALDPADPADQDLVQDFIDKGYADITVVDGDFEITNVQYDKLVADGVVTATELLTAGVVNVSGLATKLVEEGNLEVDTALVDQNKLLAKTRTISTSVLFSYVNTAEAFEYFGAEKVVEWLGGYDQAVQYIDLAGVTADTLAILPQILQMLATNGVALTDVIYLDQLLPLLDLREVVAAVGLQTILAQIEPEELLEIAATVDVKGRATQLMTLVYNYVMKNVDKLEINGKLVAAETDATGVLTLYPAALAQALADVIPTLDELSVLENNVLVSVDLKFDYVPEGETETKSKHIALEFVLDGDLTPIRDAATKLQAVLDSVFNELVVTADRIAIDVNVPEKFAELYGELLASEDLSPELKEKIVAATTQTGEDIVTVLFDDLTIAEVLEVLETIEPTAVYEKVKSYEFVNTVLAKVSAEAPNLTLDEIWNKLAYDEVTLEKVCAVIEAETGRDVLALLEAAAPKVDGFVDRAEEIAQIEALLAKVETKLGIDVSEISVADILDRGADTDLLEKISDVVAEKVGRNVRETMRAYTPDELWAAALEKAANSKDTYNKVRNKLLAALDRLPAELENATLEDMYDENGVFAKSGTFSFSPKAYVEQLLTEVLGAIDNDELNNAVELVMARIADETMTTEFSLTARFNNLFKITYKDRDEHTLFTAFLPVGADLSVFKNKSELTGYEFTGWADAEGNVVEVMPAHDLTVYADLHSVELKFVDADENELGVIYLPQNGSLNLKDDEGVAKYLEALKAINAQVALPTPEGDALKLFDSYRVVWNFTNADGAQMIDVENEIGLDITFAEDTTLVVDQKENYFLSFVDDTSIEYEVSYNNGKYTLTILNGLPQAFVLNLDHDNLLAHAKTDATVSLTVAVANGDFDLVSFKNETLAALADKAQNKVEFLYATESNLPASFAGTLYEGLNGFGFYSFGLKADDATIGTAADFGNVTIDIQVPFAGAQYNDPTGTRVYTVANGVREYVETTVVKDGYVQFNAPHFSDFLVANEYKVNLNFVPNTINGTLAGGYGELYFPEGAEFNLNFVDIGGYEVISITDNNNVNYNLGDAFTMPAAEVTFTVVLNLKDLHVYYLYYDATAKALKPAAETFTYRVTDTGFDKATFQPTTAFNDDAKNAVPNGYSKASIAWTALDRALLGVEDVYLFATWTPISYTITFKDEAGNTVGTLADVTAENYTTKFALPAVLAGMTGSWSIKTKNLPTDLTDATKNTVTIVLSGNLAEIEFEIIHGQYVTDETPTSATAGESVTVKVEDRGNGYEVSISVKDANGTTVPVTNGAFEMPASNVTVEATYTAKAFKYTINGVEGSGKYLDTITFTVTLKNGEVLTAPEGCALVSTKMNGTDKVLTYSFLLDGEKTVTYSTASGLLSILKIFNGKLFGGEGDPETIKNVQFDGWSKTLLGNLSFGMVSLIDATASLLWLWILLAVLILIAIIALLYVLYINGKISRPRFLMRFVVWIVGLFFALCLAMAALALKVAHLFGKSEDPDDYGFTEVEPEEEAAEETAEEATEEATEEAAEEATEETAEEATEETAEEATEVLEEEPATEETPAEATEEASEAPATEVEATEAAEDATETEKKDNQ